MPTKQYLNRKKQGSLDSRQYRMYLNLLVSLIHYLTTKRLDIGGTQRLQIYSMCRGHHNITKLSCRCYKFCFAVVFGKINATSVINDKWVMLTVVVLVFRFHSLEIVNACGRRVTHYIPIFANMYVIAVHNKTQLKGRHVILNYYILTGKGHIYRKQFDSFNTRYHLSSYHIG